MRSTFSAFREGAMTQPPRSQISIPDVEGILYVMPAFAARTFGAKLLAGVRLGRPPGTLVHEGVVVLFDGLTGQAKAIVDGGAITQLRTAAVSALATDILAPVDADSLALIGAGTQARTHLAAITTVRDIRRVRVWSRSLSRARSFVESVAGTTSASMTFCKSAQAAMRDAAIICTLTASSSPVILGRWLEAGQHLVLVGSSRPDARELDGEGLSRCRIFVDDKRAALTEAGDIIMALEEGFLTMASLEGDLVELVTHVHPGRKNSSDITLFKSVGLAIEDLTAAEAAVHLTESRL